MADKLTQSEATALDLLSRMRFACGDDGKRMQDELEEYLRELKRDADMLRFLAKYPNLYTVADLLKADQYVTVRQACVSLMQDEGDNA